MLGQFLGALARTEEPSHLHGLDVLAHEPLARSALIALRRVWGLVTEASVHALGPHSGRFHKVRIRGNDALLWHCCLLLIL